MPMFFRLPGDFRKVYQLNPELRLIREFKGLNSGRKMCMVMLIADNYSPFRYYDNDEGDTEVRREVAVTFKHVRSNGALTPKGNDIVNGNLQDIEAAIRFYRKMQGDSESFLLRRFKKEAIDMLNRKPSDSEGTRLYLNWMGKLQTMFDASHSQVLGVDQKLQEIREMFRARLESFTRQMTAEPRFEEIRPELTHRKLDQYERISRVSNVGKLTGGDPSQIPVELLDDPNGDELAFEELEENVDPATEMKPKRYYNPDED